MTIRGRETSIGRTSAAAAVARRTVASGLPPTRANLFTERLELPRGDARERASCRDRVYGIRGAESRMLATVGRRALVVCSRV